MKEFCEYIKKIFEVNKSIKILKISSSFMNFDEIAEILKNNETLTDFEYFSSNPYFIYNHQNFNNLSEVLKNNSSLTRLKIVDNHHLYDGDFKPLFSALKYNTTLTELDLSGNKIQDIEKLGESLKINNTLTKLNLSNNEILYGLQYLGEALKINTSLTYLDLNNNSIVNLKYIIESLKVNETLNTLKIFNNIHQEFFYVNNGIVYKDNIKLYEALRMNSTLTELDYDKDDSDKNIEDYMRDIGKSNFVNFF